VKPDEFGRLGREAASARQEEEPHE
jgi:hypothetical protein